MIKFVLKKNANGSSSSAGKYFAYPVNNETVNITKLAEHMAKHNSPFSDGAIRGILTDMVACIRELILDGKQVKIDNLAIFSLGIRNKKGGANSPQEFNATQNIEALRMRARGTGNLMTAKISAQLKKAEVIDYGTLKQEMAQSAETLSE